MWTAWRPDNDDCVTVQHECVERIEKHSPSQYVQLIHTMPFRSLAHPRNQRLGLGRATAGACETGRPPPG